LGRCLEDLEAVGAVDGLCIEAGGTLSRT
jgi:hypothetical protein